MAKKKAVKKKTATITAASIPTKFYIAKQELEDYLRNVRGGGDDAYYADFGLYLHASGAADNDENSEVIEVTFGTPTITFGKVDYNFQESK